MSAGQVVLLALTVPAYGRLVSSMPTHALDQLGDGVLRGCLVSSTCSRSSTCRSPSSSSSGLAIFNLMIVAQFWSFANAIYIKDEGERLFAIVGFGASLGAVVGARVAARLIEPFGVTS